MKAWLHVEHKGEWKPVGRFQEWKGVHVFEHEEHKRSQEHFGSNSPGGIDVVVLDYLQELQANGLGAIVIVHRYKDDPVKDHCWTASLDSYVKLSMLLEMDGRVRRFLDWALWREGSLERSPFVPPMYRYDIPTPPTVWKNIAVPTPKVAEESPQRGLGL